MNLTGGCAATLTGTVSFSYNHCSRGVDGYPNFGDVHSQKGAAIFPGENTAGIYGFAAPAVEPEDPIGLGDGEPSLDIGELAAIGLAPADLSTVEIWPQRLDLLC